MVLVQHPYGRPCCQNFKIPTCPCSRFVRKRHMFGCWSRVVQILTRICLSLQTVIKVPFSLKFWLMHFVFNENSHQDSTSLRTLAGGTNPNHGPAVHPFMSDAVAAHRHQQVCHPTTTIISLPYLACQLLLNHGLAKEL